MDMKALQKIGYGIYVVCSKDGDRINGQIANSLFQVCSEPPLVAVAINRNNLTHDFIVKSGVFTASVMAQDTPLSFIGQFGFKSGRDVNKFESVNYRTGETGAPIVLDHALAHMEARVVSKTEVGTHTIFVGQVIAAEVVKEGEPMTYAYYHLVKRGATPKSAPHYIEEKKEAAKPAMDKYECNVCGYVYDPAAGDPDNGVAPGTPWEKLPANWVCPNCGAGKDEFKKV